MRTGVQWTGTIGPRQTRRWFTYNWYSGWHVHWSMMPTSPRRGAPQLDWDVAVERAGSDRCTYWITVMNLTDRQVTFEGRYTIMNS